MAETVCRANLHAMRESWLRPDVISGSDMLLRSLLLEGVQCVFGYPGGAVLYIYDALHDFHGFSHVLARHEQGAIHAADGYARASGKTGVCIATSGPGATNLITGIAMAYKDNVPLVVVTGNVASVSKGTDAFQEADVIGISLPITKHNYYVSEAEAIPATVREAFRIASEGRKGPVLIDIPKDVSSHRRPFVYPDPGLHAAGAPAVHAGARQIEAALREIGRCSRPLLLCGEGIGQAGAHVPLLELAEKTRIPLVMTPHGIGGVPGRHPLLLGLTGAQGDAAARLALRECDLLIVAGSRLDWRVGSELAALSPGARILHIDYDEGLAPSRAIDAGCYGDPASILGELAGRADRQSSDDWPGRLAAAIPAAAPVRSESACGDGFAFADALAVMANAMPDDVIVTADESRHRDGIAGRIRLDLPRSLVCPVAMEAPGFSLPAAIGAKQAHPGRTVVSVSGHAGIQKCAQELAVCAIRGIALIVVVFTQQGDAKASSPDYMKLAEAYGVKGLKADRRDAAEAACAEALKSEGPVLIEFAIEDANAPYPDNISPV